MSERGCVANRPASRGFAVIALDNPKFGGNVGGAMRAAHCFGAELVVIAGQRFRREQPDTTQAWLHIPTLSVGDVFDAIPFDCVPVAVDLLADAIPLPVYQHPPRAFYIFGAEDATLGKRIIDRCRDKIVVPTTHCMNLAVTVNVVLYDRISKQGQFGAMPVSRRKERQRMADSLDPKEWSGSPDPLDPDNHWIDDITGERINAHTGERTAHKK